MSCTRWVPWWWVPWPAHTGLPAAALPAHRRAAAGALVVLAAVAAFRPDPSDGSTVVVQSVNDIQNQLLNGQIDPGNCDIKREISYDNTGLDTAIYRCPADQYVVGTFPDGRELTLPVNAPVLFYLQRLRDEAHRFAIGAHRTKRARAITASPLDEVPGIGPARKKALLMHFGTAGAVRDRKSVV